MSQCVSSTVHVLLFPTFSVCSLTLQLCTSSSHHLKLSPEDSFNLFCKIGFCVIFDCSDCKKNNLVSKNGHIWVEFDFGWQSECTLTRMQQNRDTFPPAKNELNVFYKSMARHSNKKSKWRRLTARLNCLHLPEDKWLSNSGRQEVELQDIMAAAHEKITMWWFSFFNYSNWTGFRWSFLPSKRLY